MSNIENGGFGKRAPNNVILEKMDEVDEIKDIVVITEYKNGDMSLNFSEISAKQLIWLQYYFNQAVREVVNRTRTRK